MHIHQSSHKLKGCQVKNQASCRRRKSNYFFAYRLSAVDDHLSDKQIDKIQKDFWNNVNNTATISCNLLSSDDVQIADYKGFKLMLFYIPRAKAEQRPVYRTPNPYNGTYKRNYEGDYKCTAKEVQRMFADADYSNNPEDSRILRGYTMDDLDKDSLQEYRQLFRSAKPDNPWLALDDLTLLKKLGGYRVDRVTGQKGFTLAGLLMFGKTEAITDNECAPNFFPDYREKLTDDPATRWTNRIYPDGTWEANLFQFYRRVLPRLQSVLPKPFLLKGNIRVEETPAHVAVREALINLCVHADYSEDAALIVIHERNRFVFSNPGTLLISKEQYYQGGESICRNKSLQKMFLMLGVAEKAGGGADKIMSGWKESNWRSPILEETVQPDKVVLTMPMESLIDDKIKEHLQDLFGKNVTNLPHNDLIALSLAGTEGYVTNERLRYSLSLHKQGITELLKTLCQNGLLVSQGHGRGTRYVLPDHIGHVPDLFESSNVASEGANVTSKTSNVASKEVNVASKETNVASNKEANVASSNKLRMSKGDLEDLIMENCKNWISREELAVAVHRNETYLRNHILKDMIKEGKLEMLYPGTPTHKFQKYKAKE